MNRSAMKQSSALLPIVMSLAALTVVLVHVALFGAAREADEGVAAHLFQLPMAGQLPFVSFFAIKWLPRDLTYGLRILILHGCVALAAFAPVYFLHL